MNGNVGDKNARSRPVDVSVGLYVLRYSSAEDTESPPFLTVFVPPQSHGKIELVPFPGVASGALSVPGDILVVRAFAPAQMFISISPRRAGGSVAAGLDLEDLTKTGLRAGTRAAAPLERARAVAEAPAAAGRGEAPRAARRVDLPAVAVLAHVARQGDVTAQSGEWLGGPKAPARIEGVSVLWENKPENVDLEVRALVGSRGQGKTQAGGIGDFVGTRGKSTPLVGLTLELAGPQARFYGIRGEFLFLGCHVVSQSGRAIKVAGPTGTEPLVGLRLWIEPAPGPQEYGTEAGPAGRAIESGAALAQPRSARSSSKVFRRPGALTD